MSKKEIERLNRELEDANTLLFAAGRAHAILSKGIKKALKLKEWPNFYNMYGRGCSLMAECKARFLIEEVEKLREKAEQNDKPKGSRRNSVRKSI
jgi:hypothetical protein